MEITINEMVAIAIVLGFVIAHFLHKNKIHLPFL